MKKYILIFIACILSSLGALAQQELMVSQYMFNGLLLNPAYAGTHDYFQTSLLHRSQWVNFDEAPTTQVFAIDGPIANNKLGVGLLITNDQLGVEKQTQVGGNIAYHLDAGTGKLSFGLSATASMYNADLSSLVVVDENDALYAEGNIGNEVLTKFGFGIYYHTDKFYAGLSVPTIYSLDDAVLPSNSSFDTYFDQHYYLNSGFVIEPNYNFAIKPSMLVKYQAEAPVEVDLNCNFLFFRKFWLGAGYRTGDAMIGMLEYNITPQFRLGYAYDFTLTGIKEYSSGSHEVMLGFDFGKDILVKKKSIRYF